MASDSNHHALLSRRGIHFKFPNVKEIICWYVSLRFVYVHHVISISLETEYFLNLTTKMELQQSDLCGVVKFFQIVDVSANRARKTSGNYFSSTTQTILSWAFLAYQSPVWPCRLHRKDQPMDESAISITILLVWG